MDEREKALERLQKLLQLQTLLEKKYSTEQYNIFVFGSYITTSYVEGHSDIDIAVYSTDFSLYKKISMDIEEFFYKYHVPVDIFYIDTSMVAPFYCAALESKVRFTDYYPAELEQFAKQCQQKLFDIKERMAG